MISLLSFFCFIKAEHVVFFYNLVVAKGGGMKLEVEQISLFESEVSLRESAIGKKFDLEKANIQYVNSKVRYVELKVLIPAKSKTIQEVHKVKKTTTYDAKYELFNDYVEAIWLYKHARDKSFNWEQAERLSEKARNEQSEVNIRLYLHENYLVPENVTQYL